MSGVSNGGTPAAGSITAAMLAAAAKPHIALIQSSTANTGVLTDNDCDGTYTFAAAELIVGDIIEFQADCYTGANSDTAYIYPYFNAKATSAIGTTGTGTNRYGLVHGWIHILTTTTAKLIVAASTNGTTSTAAESITIGNISSTTNVLKFQYTGAHANSGARQRSAWLLRSR